jgi:hypothetical protein
MRHIDLGGHGITVTDVRRNLPPAELLDQVAFLSPAQIATAKQVLADNWGPMVADA